MAGESFREFGCATSCYVLKFKDYAIVIDCGSGLYRAEEILSDCTRVDILLTHMHYDHTIGLLGQSVFPKDADVYFFSNFDEEKRCFHHFFSPPFWPYMPNLGEVTPVAPGEILRPKEDVVIKVLEGSHPNGCLMFEIIHNEKKIFFVGDYEHGTLDLEPLVKDCDWLIYDGMYSDEEYPNHIGWGHSTWDIGCRLAKKSGVKNLLITHHSPGNKDARLRHDEALAQEIFPHTSFAREGTMIKL